MPRQFYRTLITVEVLSEDRLPEEMDLTGVDAVITNGDASGHILSWTDEVIDGSRAAQLLLEQGSDPEFFRLTTGGADMEDL